MAKAGGQKGHKNGASIGCQRGFEGPRLVLMAWLAIGGLAKYFWYLTIKIGRTGSWNYDSAQVSEYDEVLFFQAVALFFELRILPPTNVIFFPFSFGVHVSPFHCHGAMDCSAERLRCGFATTVPVSLSFLLAL